jgi:DNA polymerase-3 subunit delta
MAVKQKDKKENLEYDNFRKDLAAGTTKNLYVFYGEERYLLSFYLEKLRARVAPGTEEFNHKRFDGKNMVLRDLAEAVDALPVFSEYTFTEIWDYDFSKMNEDSRNELKSILSDIPEYTCVVFVFDTIEFKLDGRVKANSEIKKLLTAVEFKPQENSELNKWIAKHFKSYGKKIDKGTAEYLSFITGGLMTSLSSEINKVASYAPGEVVTRADVDAVVIPVVDAQTYELTDAILNGNSELAMKKLSDLLSMNEAPHKILFSIALKIRQLLCAKVLQKSGRTIKDFMDLCGIKYEFQARGIFTAAKKTSTKSCRKMTECTSETAYKLNSTSQDGGDLLKELLVKLTIYSKAA